MPIKIVPDKEAPNGLYYLVDYAGQHEKYARARKLEEVASTSASPTSAERARAEAAQIYDELAEGFVVRVRPQNQKQLTTARAKMRDNKMTVSSKGGKGFVFEGDPIAAQTEYRNHVLEQNVLEVRGLIDVDDKPITDIGQVIKLFATKGTAEVAALDDIMEAIGDATHLEKSMGEALASRLVF